MFCWSDAMRVRQFIAAMVFAAAFAAPAHAQEGVIARSAEAPAAAAPDLTQTAAAIEDVYRALFFDLGIFDAIAAHQLPMYRQAATSSEYYRSASAEHRAALDRVIEDTPDIMRAEVLAEMPVMAANIAPRVASLLTPEEISGFANMFRSPELRPLLDRMVGRAVATGAESATVEPTEEERARLAEFEASPLGRAIVLHGNDFLAIVNGEFQAATPRVASRLQRALAVRICAALEDECPRDLREAVAGGAL
jgi:hypothetical protein